MPVTGSVFSFIKCVLWYHLLSHKEVNALSASFNVTPSDTVTVVGRDAQLNCRFNNLGSQTPSWKFKEGDRYVEVTMGFTTLRLGYDLTGDTSKGVYHLLMRNVTSALAGNYECTLVGSSDFGRAELLVLEHGPICDVNPGHTVVTDTTDVTLTCRVDGNSKGDLVWLKNGNEISRVNASTNDYSTRLQKADNGAVFNCQYEHDNISTNLWPQLTCADDVIMNVQYPATVAVTNNTTGPFLEGDEVFAVCEITEDGNPETMNAWYWLEPDGRNNSDGGVLNLGSVTRRDNGTYTCVAENMYYDNSTGRGIALYDVLVHYSPSVQIEDSSGGKVIEGDVYLARCHVDANPEGDIAWTDFNDDIISHDQELIITDSKRSESGRYTCHVNNTYLNGQTGYGNSSIFMDVQYPPDVSVADNSNGRVIQGYTYTADCVADSNPEADFKWTFPDGRLSTSSQLEIPSALKSDSGNYTCEVYTTFWDGTQGKASTQLYLDVQYEPVITSINYGPIGPTGQVIVNSSISVLCDVMESNPGVDVVAWEHGGDWLNFTSVTRDDHGTYTCTAMNTFWDNTPGSTMLQMFLDVQYNPEIAFSYVDNFGLEGRPFTKHCEVSGNPIASSVQWKYGDVVVSGNETLELTLQRSHEGEYTCYATAVFWDGTRGVTSASFVLDVQYSPIVNVEKKTVTVKEGESATLNCEIDSNPEVAYHNWTKGGAVVSTDFNYVIEHVKRSDAGVYRCTASSEFYDGTLGTGYNETEVNVEYIPDVSVEKADWMRKEGEQVTFTCTVDSNPEVTFHNWTKDGAVVSTDLRHAIANVQRQNAGTYQCIAGNVFYDGTTGTGSSATELTVQYFPDVEVDKKTVTVKEGEDAALNCEVDSKPEVTYHNWTYVYGGAVLSTNLSLVIENVQRHNAGIYVCIAGNVFHDGSPGTGYNETELIVEYSPEVKVDRTTLMVKEGENITLSCEIDSHPEAAYHNWTKGGVVVSSDLSHVINVVQRSDAGVYMCIAGTEFYDGSVGTGYNTTELNVQYIPDVMVDKKTVTVKEGENVTFYCEIDSNPDVTYQNWTKGGVVVSTELNHRIQNVQRQDAGEYMCVAGTTFYDGTMGTGYDKTELFVQYIPEIMVDKQIVTVKEGENVILNCEIDSTPEVTYQNWTKDGAVVSTDLSHTVNNVQPNDAGAYVCIAGVDFYDGTSATADDETILNVEYFPDVKVEKATLTVKEGERATFICNIDSNPEVTYHNWTNGVVVLSTHLSHTIEKTERLDSGVYVCVAGNVLYDGTLGTGYSETELNVEYIPEVTIDNRNSTIKEGESATFTCNVVSNPEVNYHNWTKDGAVISTDLSHSVSNATRRDAGLYTCIAGNVFHDGSIGMAYDTAELTVQYGPDVKINGSVIVVTEGESAFLDCVIDANPLAESYNWTKGDMLVSSNLTHFIERTSRDDAGVYECRASNTLYDGTTATGNDTVLLVVEYPPVVRIEGPSGPVAENDLITIRCTVEDGIPDPYKMSLYLSNVTGVFEVDWTEDHRGVTNHAFDIVDIKRWAAGSYYCVAWSSFNDSKDYDGRSDTIDITVNYKDDPAANVTVIIVIVVGILILIIIFVAIIRKTNKRRKREKYKLKQSASGINGSGENKDELHMDKLEMDRTPPDGYMTQENIYQ